MFTVKKINSSNLLSVMSLNECLAKSRKLELHNLPGRLVLSHCHIVGEVARAMILRMPKWIREDLFPEGSELIAAAHDIGKVSPTFQNKIYSNLTQRNENILSSLKKFNPEIEKNWKGHGGVSQASASAENVGKFIPEILGQHHGYSPDLSYYQATSEIFGGQLWHDLRLDLLSQLKEKLNVDFPVVKNDLQAKVLSGLTSVADWVGSGALFDDPADDNWLPKVNLALDEAGFVKPQLKPNLSFTDIFGFTAKDTQSKLIAAVKQPGVYILEAPMGLGKTEAALYAAYQLIDKGLATGFYFALPTQLTSDKIHERVNAFLERILSEASPHKKALLVHGNAKSKQFVMGEEANPGGAWFAHGKRGILAPFAVGTVDQALMSVMNVKHGFVRTFGLAGKVVILDEVHSYDSYTGTILDSLISSLRQLHCTVIILSATLTFERRTKLLGETSTETAYPLITAQTNNAGLIEFAVEKIPDVSVAIYHENNEAAFDEALNRASQGQQVLWIENTVNEAQHVFKRLGDRAQSLGVDCGLLHSRFTKENRATNEDKWVMLFGKEGASSRAIQGRILVGTQVLEQSLDIDADFLVSRIAPTDMLLQRLGRLWRHTNTLRAVSAKREVWIVSPELDLAITNPKLAFGASANVYAPYVLCRTLQVWQSLAEILLPSHIRPLIDATYASKDEADDMLKHRLQLENSRAKLQSLALRGLSKGGTTQSEESAQTRHSELESTDVLLIRAYQQDQAKQGAWVTLLNLQKIWLPYNGKSLAPNKWRELSTTLMQNTLKVTDYLAPSIVSRLQVKWLSDYFYLGRPELDESVSLRVALVGPSGAVKSISGAANDNYSIEYDEIKGYQTNKLKAKNE